MDYEHHVFISYKSDPDWGPWVRNNFVRRLEKYLRAERGSTDVFVDNQIQCGARWEQVLHRKITRSRLMVALLTAEYFESMWCKKEMALMIERHEAARADPSANHGFLIPVHLGDGESFPARIKDIQQCEFEDYLDDDIPPGTLRASNFNQEAKKLAKLITNTLKIVPPWDVKWESLNGSTVLPSLNPVDSLNSVSRLLT